VVSVIFSNIIQANTRKCFISFKKKDTKEHVLQQLTDWVYRMKQRVEGRKLIPFRLLTIQTLGTAVSIGDTFVQENSLASIFSLENTLYK